MLEEWFHKFQSKESELPGESYEDIDESKVANVTKLDDDHLDAGQGLDSPPNFSRCASVESGDSSPKGSSSLLGRQRLSSFFRLSIIADILI